MPVCYGGNVRTIKDIETILALGVEKVSISSCAVQNPFLVREASENFGSQSIIVCIDVRGDSGSGYEVVTHNAKRVTGLDPVRHAVHMEKMGAGELLVNSVDRDGTMSGYDIGLIRRIARSVDIPVVACGGAGKLDHMRDVIKDGGASAAAAGSLFVFYGKLRAVLLNYPDRSELEAELSQESLSRS
jgi:cyclase